MTNCVHCKTPMVCTEDEMEYSDDDKIIMQEEWWCPKCNIALACTATYEIKGREWDPYDVSEM